MKIKFLLIVILFSIVTQLGAQTRYLTGTISAVDDKNEPISFANVVVPGTTIGVMADFEGNFKIRVPENCEFIEILALGYKARKVDVSNKKKTNYSIRLEEDAIELGEVTVKSKSTPAMLIQKKVARNRKYFDPEVIAIYSCSKYLKHQFYLSEVDSAFMNSVFFKKHPEAFIKQSNTDSSMSLPVSFHEQITDEFKQKFPPKQRITIKGEQFTGVKAFSGSEINNYIGTVETNFYQNYLRVLDLDFVSPLSNLGPSFYEYFINDTLIIDNIQYFKLKFKPRRPKEHVFFGYFYVNMTDYSVSRVDAEITPYTNINFVKNLNISQTYKKIEDSTYFYDEEKVTIDFVYTPSDDTTQSQTMIRSVRSVKYSNVELNPDTLQSIVENALVYEVVHDENAANKDTSFWNNHRAAGFDSTEQKALESINTVNDIGIVKTTDKLLDVGLNGYIGTKYFDIGPWEDLIRQNEVEGLRYTISGRTTGELTGRHALSGFLAYGSRDKVLKYGGGYAVEFSNGRYQVLSTSFADNIITIGSYKNTLQYLRENMFSRGESNIITSLLKRNPNYELYRLQDADIRYEREWSPGFINRIYLNYGKHFSGEFVPFTTNSTLDTISHFTTQEITLNTRLAWKEKVLTKHFRRVYLGTSKPRINLDITLGQYNIKGKTDTYVNMRGVVRHYFPLWIGKLACNYEFGYIFGTMPYPILEIPRGNESYGYARYSYNLVNNLEYVHDKFAGALIEYNTMGLIFNRIPLIKKMNLRENFIVKTMWGECDTRHKTIMDFPTTTTPLNGVYAEVGCGITNIFKFLRVQWTWRLTDPNKPDVYDFITQASILIEF